MTDEDDKRIGDALDALPLQGGDISAVLRAIDGAGFALAPKEEAQAANPLEALGLGVNWRPSPTSWRWSTIDVGGEKLSVLKLANAGGVLGGTFIAEQVEQFIHDTQAHHVKVTTGHTKPLELAHRQRLHVPGR